MEGDGRDKHSGETCGDNTGTRHLGGERWDRHFRAEAQCPGEGDAAEDE